MDPGGQASRLGISRSTVRTMSEAPASSSERTQPRLADAAAMCSAVRPFSARLSMYLRAGARARVIGPI